MNRLLSMQVFCRVVDCQGFASAARTLDMSPPVVTRLISDLETHLAARLLNRSTSRKLVLTEAGRIYLDQVRRILADIEEAEASVQSATQRVGGERARAQFLDTEGTVLWAALSVRAFMRPPFRSGCRCSRGGRIPWRPRPPTTSGRRGSLRPRQWRGCRVRSRC